MVYFGNLWGSWGAKLGNTQYHENMTNHNNSNSRSYTVYAKNKIII